MIPDWATERKRMVDRQLRRRGITDERVLAAMLAIPREEFVPLELRVLSYRDDPVSIGFGQTISQPYMVALMAQCLGLKGAEVVLDVGTGSGYGAALLGVLAARVVSIELIEGLARLARRNLKQTGWGGNVAVVAGDGSMGYRECAPYDAIAVAAGAPDVPDALVEQLREAGRLVIPVGSRLEQSLMIVTKRKGVIKSRVETHCRFVPLLGNEGWR
jgi:protein-L-isoaspartate(D-aspartate) O-methyltransferase